MPTGKPNSMSSPTVTRVSECFVKPPHRHHPSPEFNTPLYFTPFDLRFINADYSQKGLLFTKRPPENQDFSITTFLNSLRRSLSATLTHFHPLAARFATRKQENPPSFLIYIDPENTPGVKFIHATVDITVSDILNSVNVPSVVHSFFDLNDAISYDGHTLPLLSIQVTELTDGIFIGGSVNHLLADGTSFWHFMAVWSEIFRSKDKNGSFISRPPIFKRWIDIEGFDSAVGLPFTHQDQFIDRSEKPRRLKERFFHFSSVSVAKLKEKANEECNTKKISSLQAVSALLWRCVSRVRNRPGKSETICQLVISNRGRMDQPLSDDYFGNPIDVVRGSATVDDLITHGLGWVALRLHEAVRNHDHVAVKNTVQSWYAQHMGRPEAYKMRGLLPPNIVHIGSSPRFDMYGCEFGLGKAVAARSGFANKADGKMTMYPGPKVAGAWT